MFHAPRGCEAIAMGGDKRKSVLPMVAIMSLAGKKVGRKETIIWQNIISSGGLAKCHGIS